MENECICEGNWRNLVKRYEHLINRKFRDRQDKDIYEFIGLIHGSDDYYYGLWKEGNLILSSCVGDLEEFYELVEEEITDPCPDCGKQLEPQLRGGVICPDIEGCGYWFCF